MFKKDPLQIIAFTTYGTDQSIYLKGRGLEDEHINLEHKGWLNLFINSYRRFETDEVRNSPIKISLQTDAEGYYTIDQEANNLLELTDADGWFGYEVSLQNKFKSHKILNNNVFYGEMLIPKNTATFGVISDIDDTILHTGVASPLKWRVVVNTLFKTPHKRKALEGVAEFYNLLHKGATKNEANPIFYVSNSPWNLYRYLHYFLSRNQFPKGPILLRDFRTPFDRTRKPDLAHKYFEINKILNSYPHLNFILIGDCGEKDAYIYLDIVRAFPNRIAAIYLRTVKHKLKMKRISNLFLDYKEVPVLIVNTTKEAIEHAKSLGFVG